MNNAFYKHMILFIKIKYTYVHFSTKRFPSFSKKLFSILTRGHLTHLSTLRAKLDNTR